MLITDERCLEHAAFDKYHNVVRRQQQKDEVPENAERLMVLIEKDRGVLTQTSEFLQNQRYTVQKKTQPVSLADMYRVHDYNYLMKVLQMSNKLSLFQSAPL